MQEVRERPMRSGKPVQFSVLRVPFFLEPDYDTSEDFQETNRERLLRKWSGAAGFAAQKRRHGLKERGREVGIEHFDLDRVASSTLASHRLVQWVTKRKGVTAAEALYSALNHRHFELGQKLNDRRMLVQVAQETAGVDPAAAEAFLASEEGVAEINEAQQMLRRLGVSGIPTLVLGAKAVLPSGALSSEYLVQAFRQLEEASVEGAPDSVFAEARVPAGVLCQRPVREPSLRLPRRRSACHSRCSRSRSRWASSGTSRSPSRGRGGPTQRLASRATPSATGPCAQHMKASTVSGGGFSVRRGRAGG
jgi:predicted DsbA family dithiol-disulfide isomerase